MEFFDRLTGTALALGAYRAAVIPVSDVETDRSFRTLCEQNVCGNYGKNHMCPPDAGDIDELIGVLRSFKYIFVYQSVGTLEDSFDIEGMAEAAKNHRALMMNIIGECNKIQFKRRLYLGAGGCTLCEVCAKRTNEKCRHPDRAVPSLEAYGVNVSALAKAAGMKYINGQNTVTYFGAVLFDFDDEKL
jgi:predicted metal-binding protein